MDVSQHRHNRCSSLLRNLAQLSAAPIMLCLVLAGSNLAAAPHTVVDYVNGTYDHLLYGSDVTDAKSAEVVMGRADASYFANQATFGATADLVREIQQHGRSGWIDKQIAMSRGQSHHRKMIGTDLNKRLRTADVQFGTLVGGEWVVPQMWQTWIEEPDQLRQRVAAALLEIFVVTARVDAIGISANQYVASSFVDLLEYHSFGNYRNLLIGVSRHPAMAHYLSFIDNKKADYDGAGNEIRVPDENYARELLQLFTIGLYELNLDGTLKLDRNGKPIETYNQTDISNLARVFTGWSLDNETVRTGNKYADRYANLLRVNADWHSPEAKSFLGLTIPAGTSAENSLVMAVNHIFNHPNVAPFISRQLIQRFVTSNPSTDYVRRVASAFQNNGSGVRGDMEAVIKAIFLDSEASNRKGSQQNTLGGKLREPMMRLTAIARITRDTSATTHYPITDLSDTSFGLGQSPLKSASVFNFFRPGYTPPGSDLASRGMVAPEFQIVTGSAIPGAINTTNNYIATADSSLMTRGWKKRLNRMSREPEKLVNVLSLMFTAHGISAADRADMVRIVEQYKLPKRRVMAAMQMVTSHPEFLLQR